MANPAYSMAWPVAPSARSVKKSGADRNRPNARKIEAKPELGYRIVGFVDEQWAGTDVFLKTGYRLCCDFESLPSFLRANVIDEIGLFLPLRSFYEYAAHVAALFENGAEGPLAAPIVRDVLKAYFDKKARLAQPQPQIARLPTDLFQAPPLAPASSAAVNQ